MLSRDDLDRLLLGVRGWFDDPAQVDHYQQEAANGPTPAESWLLARYRGRVAFLISAAEPDE